MNKIQVAEFHHLTFSYEGSDGTQVDNVVLYHEDTDQFFLGVDINDFEIRRYIKLQGFAYVIYNEKVYAPMEFFRRISALIQDHPDSDTTWLDELEQQGRRHLIATDFKGGEISVTVN